MVKNKIKNKAPRLSPYTDLPPLDRAAIDDDRQVYDEDKVLALVAELGSMGAEGADDNAASQRREEIWGELGRHGILRPGRGQEQQRSYEQANAPSWERRATPLYRADRTPAQSISTHDAAQASPRATLGAQDQSELGVRRDSAKQQRTDVKPKSLYEALSEIVSEAEGPASAAASKEPERGVRRDPAKQQRADVKPKSLYEAFSEATGSVSAAAREEPQRLLDEFQRSLFENFTERWNLEERLQTMLRPERDERTKVAQKSLAVREPEEYTQPFIDFLTENPTVFHAVDYFEKKLENAGFKKLSERDDWSDLLEPSGKYFVSRNGSALIAFTVGRKYRPGNGVAMIGGHIDALTARVKPVSNKKTSAGYVQLGVAPYAGALNSTWWDRDLGIGGKVLVREAATGRTVTKLVKLGWPIARIPTLAPHFGRGMTGSQNKETETVPIIGLDNSDISKGDVTSATLGAEGSFASTQSPRLVRAIAKELGISDYSSIVNWELELYDIQPAQTGGLDKEFIFGGRIDDKLCSWAALEALLSSSATTATGDDGIVKLVALFDDEEIGSLLYQGARGNFLPATVERIVETFAGSYSANTISRTYANSFLVSADVTHAVNPNFLGSYLEDHAPRLNVGLVVSADSNGHMTTNSVSTAVMSRIAEKNGDRLQTFMIRNDSRSGGTIGPALSSALGVRAIDTGIPQLSMHSIRATTGSLDPGLGVKTFAGFFEHFESVDREFE